MRLDLIQTVAFAGLMLFVGYGLKRMVPVLARYNIPAPVVGGLPVAALFALLHSMEWAAPTFDTTLQTPLQNTFFASIGFGASHSIAWSNANSAATGKPPTTGAGML